MKAWQIQGSFGLDNLKQCDLPKPEIKSNQVLLKMRGWSLNYRDLLVATGRYNPKIPLPFTPLSDGVGEVVEVGADVSSVKVGDRVAGCFMPAWIDGDIDSEKPKSSLGGGGLGMLSEFVAMDASGVVPVPEHLSDTDAGTLPCAAVTAWHALVVEGRVAAGDTILTLGTGGVSIFAVQFANLLGVRSIITSSSDDKLDRARDLGASAGINYKSTPDWNKEVRNLTNGRGVDLVIEVGGAGTMDQSLKSVRTGGTISLIGILAGAGATFSPLPILMKKVRLQGVYVGSRAMFEDMNRAIGMHRLWPAVDRVYNFDETPKALQWMEKGEHFGKICIKA